MSTMPARIHATFLAAAATLAAVGGTAPVRAQSSSRPAAEQAKVARDFQIDGKEVWFSTGLELKPGERVVFTATGTSRCPGQDAESGPAGIPRGFRDLPRILPVAQAGRGAVIGRIGD